ncbi:MAG: hypothetical protein JF603_11425 [Acidobacteria bacterium]|nr:hypothetical protein [Acidobacteriota bacterium]
MTAATSARPADPPAPGAEAGRTHLPRYVLPLAVVALFAVHVALGLRVDGPLIFDGTGYLADARWLAGKGTTFMGQASFYHPGWPLTVAPLFRLSNDPQTIYQGALLLNAALASLSLLAYNALGRALGLRPVFALFAAITAAVYPAVLLQSTIEWSESLFQLLIVLLVLSFHRLVTRPSTTSAVITGVLAPALYATHPRGLGAVPVVAVGLLVLVRLRVLSRRAAFVGVAVTLAGFVAVRVLNGTLLDAMWPANRPLSEGDVLSRLTDAHLVWNAVVRAIGQLWYLVVASCGLAMAGLWMLGDRARGGRGPRVTAFTGLILATMLAILGASSLMMADATRVDHLVYGRYNEGFLPTLIVFGAVGVLRLRTTRSLATALAAVIGCGAVLGVATVALNSNHRFTGSIAPVNVLGILVWSGDHERVDILRITISASIVAALALAARRHSARTSLVVLAGFFIASAAIVRHDDLGSWSRYWSSVHRIPDAVRALPARGQPVSMLGGDLVEPEAADFYQFQLFDRHLRRWTDGTAPAELLIAPRDWEGAARYGLRLVYPEDHYNAALWSVPGPLREQLAAGGYLFASDPLAKLPLDATQGRIDAPARVTMKAGSRKILTVRVTHTGGGSPWANQDFAGSRIGSVRVQGTWAPAASATGASGLGDLPYALLPGQHADVPLFLHAPSPPGTYQVELRLLQEGVQTFGASTTITVVVR